MLATPSLTTADLQHQLDTQDEIRFAATTDEYFALLEEQNDAVYLEFHQNQLLARPNVNTENHELITATVIRLLGNALLSDPAYRVFGSNRPVYVLDCEQGFAPDVLVVRGPTELYPRKRLMAATLNPWLLVEVLSASNRSDEFQDKIHCYKQIPALEHFFLIASDSMMVSAYTRTDRPNQWLNIDYDHPDEIVPVGDISLSMSELYRNVVFTKR
jgi:Uma2 family endonuclease